MTVRKLVFSKDNNTPCGPAEPGPAPLHQRWQVALSLPGGGFLHDKDLNTCWSFSLTGWRVAWWFCSLVDAFLLLMQEHDVETAYGVLHVTMRGVAKGNRPTILTYHDVGLNRE